MPPSWTRYLILSSNSYCNSSLCSSSSDSALYLFRNASSYSTTSHYPILTNRFLFNYGPAPLFNYHCSHASSSKSSNYNPIGLSYWIFPVIAFLNLNYPPSSSFSNIQTNNMNEYYTLSLTKECHLISHLFLLLLCFSIVFLIIMIPCHLFLLCLLLNMFRQNIHCSILCFMFLPGLFVLIDQTDLLILLVFGWVFMIYYSCPIIWH